VRNNEKRKNGDKTLKIQKFKIGKQQATMRED